MKPTEAVAPPNNEAGAQEMSSTATRAATWDSPKIGTQHLNRLAIVYVRQSSPQQVLNNRESRERQYALADHAVILGWPSDRVLVIDDDQGESGKSAEHRNGFHRVLSEVMMDHVGVVLGIEMSRLARSNKDWHHLLEVCAIFGTVLADEDGVYNPNDSNDRLLLGLKGTISEFELVTMRNRLGRGMLNKAKRGELFLHVPIGYVKTPEGGIAVDSDEQVRSVVQLIFDKFDELGSAHAVVRYLLRHDIKVGVRPIQGAQRGQVEWRRPSMSTLYAMLKHPLYAGTYVYGRCPVEPKRRATHKSPRRWVSLQETKVVLPDQVPAYITWDRFQKNLERLRENRSRTASKGATRRGPAILVGIVFCGTCGRRMTVAYGRDGHTRYTCPGYVYKGMEKPCRDVSAPPLDLLITEQVLHALEPASIEVSLEAAENIQRERDRLSKHWNQQLERARYTVGRAERHYRAVDPENRLVARTLEQQWESTLREERRLAEEFDRFRLANPPALTPEERRQILALSADIPKLWNGSTAAADRKEIVRCLVDRLVVNVRGDTEYVDVEVHWAGGFINRHTVLRPLQKFQQLDDFDRIKTIVITGREAGHTARQIADQLNAEGFRTPSQRSRKFTRNKVTWLLRSLGIRRPLLSQDRLASDEWWLSDLAVELGVNPRRLHHWTRKGYVHSRKGPSSKFWIIWADADELARLRKLRDYLSTEHRIPYPPELKRPKDRSPVSGTSPPNQATKGETG